MHITCVKLSASLLFLFCTGVVVAAQPNIILIVTDDQRPDTIGALGNDQIQTPNLDSMYESGFYFRNTYHMGGNSGAVCVPSRAMIMSGRAVGHVWNRAGMQLENLPTLPETFRNNGYHTHIVGKWHNGDASLVRSFATGNRIRKNRSLKFEPYQTSWQRLNDSQLSDLPGDGRHHTSYIGGAAVDFIYSYQEPKPFFMYIAFFAPHDPRAAPPRFDNRYRNQQGVSTLDVPANFSRQHSFDQGDAKVRDEKLLPFPRTKQSVREELAKYYSMISQIDQEVGNILDALAVTGIDENTIILFTSDHGLALGSHGLAGKQNLYEHTAQSVPLLVSGPNIVQGISDAFVYLIDIFPTLVDVAEIKPPIQLDGHSLLPIIDGEKDRVRNHAYSTYRQYQRMIRRDQWKLIYYPHLDRQQLFDLAHDPYEQNDLADDPRHAEIREALMKKLFATERRYNPNSGVLRDRG